MAETQKNIEDQKLAIGRRLLQFAISQGFTKPGQLGEALKYERSDNIYNVVNGKILPGAQLLSDISNKFGNFNLGWLLTGNGFMFMDPAKQKSGASQLPDPNLLTQIIDEMDTLKTSLHKLSESLASPVEEENEDQGEAYQEFRSDKNQKAGKR